MGNKLKKFFHEKYKILIPIMVVFVLLITLYFLYREYKYDNYRDKRETEVYQYFGGIRTDYTAIITYNLKKSIVDITPKDKKIEYDGTPIYYRDKLEVLFPKEMIVAFPLREGSQYKTYKYATYINDDSIHNIKNDTYTGVYDYFFMYDGEEVFFFPTPVKLLIDGVEYTNLSGGSYVSLVGGYTLIYYDYEEDKSEVIEIEGKKISVSSEYINVNLSYGYFMSFNDKVLLSKPYNLNALYKSDWQIKSINDIIKRE